MLLRPTRFHRVARQCFQRSFSTATEFSAFPATLFRLTKGRNPGLSATDSADGAVFEPNTFGMQEVTRMIVDQHLDGDAPGRDEDVPMIYTVAKHTEIPSVLRLVRQAQSCRFCLQPREPMSDSALNEILVEFLTKHGREQTADEWIGEHDYEDAFHEDDGDPWMAA